ncbi:MAG: metal ABC transporter permease [Pseudomonadota bacterium]
MLDDFLIRAILAGLGVALATAPLGCFVVWRRMAYFSDATAHAAILGVALALALNVPIFGGTLFIALLMALGVWGLVGRGFATDTLLGVLAHSGLAFGLVAASYLTSIRIDLMSYLFGDILAVTRQDLAVIWGGGIVVVGLLIWRWHALLLSTLNQEIALAAGVRPRHEELVLTLALAVVVAMAIKIVGVLLIGALLLIPAASARPFSATPERMAVIAALIGCCAVMLGIYTSFQQDTPTGPTIVCAAAVLFLGSVVISAFRAK